IRGCRFTIGFQVLETMISRLRAFSITAILIALTIAFAFFGSGCRRGTTTSEDTDTSTYKPESTPATEFEQKLKFVRDGHFVHVWIFTRKDGKEFDKADSDVLHANAPKVVDWVRANEGKTFIAGSK